jgi:hypothetical protein
MAPKKLKLWMQGGDAAWEDNWQDEAGRLLRQAASKIEIGALKAGDDYFLRDTNGNTIGMLVIE